MPSLTRKLIHGRPYYYLRYCQRVDGKPKIVKTTYLGPLDQLLAQLTQTQTPPQPRSVDIDSFGYVAKPKIVKPTYLAPLDNLLEQLTQAQPPPQPRSVDIASFGDVAALWDIATQLELIPLIDAHLPQRDQGLSVGQYLLLAAINRAAHPTSKALLADWYQHTALLRILPATPAQLTSQAFWNHLDRVSEKDIAALEDALSQRLVERFKLSLRTLVYDGTNFFTYINTTNPATLPARGHNKQKRTDLRQVNLGMLVSTDFHVPLFHKVYRSEERR